MDDIVNRAVVAALALSLVSLGLCASCCRPPCSLEPVAQEPPVVSHIVTEWGEDDGVGGRFVFWRYEDGSWRSVETENNGTVTLRRGTWEINTGGLFLTITHVDAKRVEGLPVEGHLYAPADDIMPAREWLIPPAMRRAPEK